MSEVNQLLRVIFNGRRQSEVLDLEAVEMLVRSAMHAPVRLADALTPTTGLSTLKMGRRAHLDGKRATLSFGWAGVVGAPIRGLATSRSCGLPPGTSARQRHVTTVGLLRANPGRRRLRHSIL
jgi:hypothetical protein